MIQLLILALLIVAVAIVAATIAGPRAHRHETHMPERDDWPDFYDDAQGDEPSPLIHYGAGDPGTDREWARMHAERCAQSRDENRIENMRRINNAYGTAKWEARIKRP